MTYDRVEAHSLTLERAPRQMHPQPAKDRGHGRINDFLQVDLCFRPVAPPQQKDRTSIKRYSRYRCD